MLRFLEAYSRPVCPAPWLGAVLVLGGLLLGAGALAGCSGSKEASEKPPDQRYGHRYAERGPHGRRTLAITPPADTSRHYFTYDVPVSEVILRAAPFAEDEDTVPAELLIKGALPNECLALEAARQERDAHLLRVTLTMRRPRGAAPCERYKRPFRFYLPLKGRYAPGDYELKVNGTSYPFSIHRND